MTRALLSPGNRAKSCVKISMYKASGELHTEDIAIERENSHFRRPHSHLTPPHQRTPTNIGIKRISPETIDRGYIFAADSIYASSSILKLSCLKIGVSLLNDSTRKTAFNAKWLFKVIQGHPNRRQNLITWSLRHALPLQEISSKSVYNFFQLSDGQTNRQTNRPK